MKKTHPVRSVPYVPVVGFEKAIHALRDARIGDPLDKAALEKADVKGNTFYQAVNALKFFKIIDGNKRITANLHLWSKGAEGRGKLIHTAFKPVLDRLKFPVKDTTPIKKAIKDQYKMADSVILLATTFFCWAVREAGINVLVGDESGAPRRGRGAKPGLGRGRRGRPRPSRRSQLFAPGAVLADAGVPGIVLNVNIQISKDTKKADLHRMLIDLRDELKEFWG